MAKRRSAEEVDKLVTEANKLVDDGMGVDAAAEKVGLSRSLFNRHRQGKIQRGSVRADSLPRRPKRGGKRIKKPLNLADIGEVAKRIASLDRKLRQIDGLVRERIRLVGHLITLLKDRKDK